ncbi:WG repeat-containing protein [Trabulsiella odontotermitis]|uniref:WG repeat-containing protein n=1 Tax=Trabulsiella odontotermitis TaxID=379893 RepID=UPI003ABFC522
MRPIRIFLHLITLFFLLCGTVAFAAPNDAKEENDTGLDDISSLNMSEARIRLERAINELSQGLATLDKIKNVHFELGTTDSEPSSREDEGYLSNFNLLTKKELDRLVATELKKPLTFRQRITSAGSDVELSLDALNEILARSQTPDSDYALYYTVQHITFIDGSEMRAADFMIEDAATHPNNNEEEIIYRNAFTILVNKPIAKMRIKLVYHACPDYKKVVLNQSSTEVTLDNGEYYRLTQIDGDSVSLIMSLPKEAQYVVEGLTPEGKSLESRGRSSSSLPSDEQIKRIHTYYQQLVETRDNIDSYPDTQRLQAHLDSLMPEDNQAKETLRTIRLTMYFRGKPENVAIYRLDAPENTTLTKEVVNRDAAQLLYIAQDSKTNRYGFIDISGKWQIAPQFEDIRPTKVSSLYEMRMGTRPLSKTISEIITRYYFVNDKRHTLSQAPFKNLSEVLTDSLILVQKESNGSFGVYDIKRHQFAIPMKYVNVETADNLFIASLGERTYGFERRYGVSTLQGKEILPFRFKGIDKVDNFIYATTYDNDQRDIYTLTGKKINPENYQTSGLFINNQPVVLKHHQTGEYRLLNAKGQLLSVKLPYDEVTPFSNGMAVVEKDNVQGAIDAMGRLRIPLEYDDIYPFQKNYAAAQTADGSRDFLIIDRKNNVIKRFAGSTSLSVQRNGNDAIYHVYDENRRKFMLDADGNVLQRDE